MINHFYQLEKFLILLVEGYINSKFTEKSVIFSKNMCDIIQNNKQIIKITTNVHSNYELLVFKAKSFLKDKKI